MLQQDNFIRLFNAKAFIQVFLIFLVFGCTSPDKRAATNISDKVVSNPDHHNSRISLDWAGTYIGTLPCADCEGVETSITLKMDLTYQSKRRFLGKQDSLLVFEQSGDFQWNADGAQIMIVHQMDTQRYLVGEGRLFHLDKMGKRIEGDMAEKYWLIKQ